ncbi:MAG: DNA polymerase III subunit chi [Pseudomonadota bacterium]
MTEVLFYHLLNRTPEQVLPSLLERSMSRGWKSLVRAGSEERADAIDAALWTYRDDSWLPHGRETDTNAERQPVLVTALSENANSADVCFAVDGAELGDPSGFSRAVYLFNGDNPDALTRAREAWKAMKGQGHEVTYWQQDADGRWVKKA